MTTPNLEELNRKIRGIFDDPKNPEYTVGDLLSDEAINQLESLISEQVRLGSSRDGRGQAPKPKQEESKS